MCVKHKLCIKKISTVKSCSKRPVSISVLMSRLSQFVDNQLNGENSMNIEQIKCLTSIYKRQHNEYHRILLHW